MTHEERAELRALADLLERWPRETGAHIGALGFSGPVCAVLDGVTKDDYSLYVFEAVTV